MNKTLEEVSASLNLHPEESVVKTIKALYFPYTTQLKQKAKIGWGKEYKTITKRRDTEAQNGLLVLTTKRLFWLQRRGTFKKTYHPVFSVDLTDVFSLNMQGRFAKRLNIATNQHGELQFRFKDMEAFIDTVNQLKEA